MLNIEKAVRRSPELDVAIHLVIDNIEDAEGKVVISRMLKEVYYNGFIHGAKWFGRKSVKSILTGMVIGAVGYAAVQYHKKGKITLLENIKDSVTSLKK